MKDPKIVRRLRVLLFLIGLLGIVALPTVVSMLVPNEVGPVAEELAALAGLPMMFILLSLFLRWESHSSFESVGLRTNGKLTRLIAVGAFSGVCASLFVFFIAVLFGGTTRTVDTIDADIVAGLLFLTIFVAVLEELCYRGYLMTRMAEIWGTQQAVIASSIVFAIAHFNWWIPLGSVSGELILMFSVNMFIGGVVLGLSYYLAGKSLWVAISFHYTWNIIAYLLFPIFPTTEVISPVLFQIEWGVTTVPGLLLGLLLIRLLIPRVCRELAVKK